MYDVIGYIKFHHFPLFIVETIPKWLHDLWSFSIVQFYALFIDEKH